MAERDWKECDLCNKEVFTKKDADGFISICPECREQDEKRLEQLASKDKRNAELTQKVGELVGNCVKKDKRIKELEARMTEMDEDQTLQLKDRDDLHEKENAILKAKIAKADCVIDERMRGMRRMGEPYSNTHTLRRIRKALRGEKK